MHFAFCHIVTARSEREQAAWFGRDGTGRMRIGVGGRYGLCVAASGRTCAYGTGLKEYSD